MDSFSFPFERMSGMDMHPLSFPISRLSPAKSSSSIDQYTHHHGKGDSAYSSFSGGSNAPDLSSPFFPDDLHAHSLHYADFKYMNSALSFGAESEPKSMDQLYRSMEALTRQCDQGSDNCSNSNQQCGKKQTSPSASASAPPSAPAPPPPARLESLVTFRNMENLWARQSPEGQTADRSHQKTRLMPAPPSPPPFASNSSSGPDTVYSLLDSQHCESVNQDASALPKSANMLSRSTQMYPSAATEHDGQKGSVAQGEVLRKRACSVHTSPPAAFVRPADSWQQSSSLPSSSPINGSIQHKGHFYFVTGVCKTEESMPVANISENSCVDVHKSVEKERVHGQVGGVQRTANQRHNSYEREYFPHAQELSVRRQEADGYLLDNALLGSTQALHVSDVLEPGQRLIGREITSRHHSPAHPIFYCGPEESMPQVQPTGQMNSIASPVTDPTIHIEKQEEQVRKVRKQPLDGVPREKINKETTPLLYHLTGANQMALMKKFKNYSDSTTTCKNSEWNSVALQHPEKEQSNSKEVNGTNICSDQCEEVKMPVDAKIDSFSYPYNTLDDSYKKYYKEKLKDVQSQVLRMTSFKRKDLQPYKIKQSHEQQQPPLQVFPSAQDPLYTTDKPSHPWPQHQFQVSDTKSRTESPTERTREIEITGGEGGPTVRKEKERRASHDNDLDLCINIKGEDKWKDTMVEEARKDVRGEGMMKDTRLEEARKDIRCEETRKDTTAEEARLDFRGEETKKPPKVAQPQVARIGGRKRLTQEQKKLCYSEPEKLHKLMDVPTHKSSHSLGNEMESLLTDSELGDQGLVAARKKLFETRGCTMSASSLSKTTLKHLQQKALVAYMERKTGQKLTEPPQPCPPVPTERHSSVGRISDCDLRLHYGNRDSKMKIHRPLSAGRILDSSSSSIRYAQFGSSPGEHYHQSSLKERSLVSSSKAASFESLLDQPELSVPCRGRSKSTPHAPQDFISTSDASSTDSSSTLKGEVTSVAAVTQTVAVAAVIPNDRCRVVVPRGKSMEELGVAKVIRPTCLSRSSEQLHQLRGGSNGSRIHSSANPSFYQSRERGVVATPGEWTQRLPEYQEGWKEAMQTDIPHGREEGTSSVGLPVGTGPLPDMAQFSSLTSTCTEAKPKGHLKESKCLSLYHLETPMPSSGKDSSPLEQNLVNQLGFSHEVALSDGVTTDPSLWPSSPAEEEEDGGEEEDEQSSSHTAMGMDTMHKLAPVSLPQSPRETPAAVEVNGTVGEKQEGEREEESQREGQMKDWEQEVASAGGSQTEEPARSTPPPQQQQQQQQHTLQTPWAALVEEVASVDQDLAHLLRPVPNRKTALMLMEQLLSEDTLLMEEHYKKKQVERASGLEGTHHQEELEGQKKEMEERGQRASVVEEHSDPSSCNREEVCSESQQDVAESLSEEDVIEKKRQLLACVEKRLSALGEQRSTLQSEEADNSKRGAVITALVAKRCPPAEQERYALFIGDLERVVSLLLCLSARLARVQNALSSVNEHTDLEEKQSLDNRHHLLCKQRDDAKDLKDNLDRRERVVSTFLSKHLTDAELQDYRRFVQTKASLLIRLKDLDESQHLGEEQRDALLCSLPP